MRPQYLADQLILFQPGRAGYPQLLLLPKKIFHLPASLYFVHILIPHRRTYKLTMTGYMKSLVKVAHESLKARCVVFNFRGRGGHPLKTPRTYCATNWEDLDSVLGTVYILGQCSPEGS